MLAVAVLATIAVACGDSGGGTPETTAGSTGTTVAGATTTTAAILPSTTLNASGATFPRAFYLEVIAAFEDVQPNVTVNYAGGGSGQGRQQFKDRVVDWAGTDALVKPGDVASYDDFYYIPTVSAPITVSFNLPGVSALVLDADTVAKIFLRQITRWDDPAIGALNSGVRMPSTAIVVAHRSDGSGTTENFTKYLAAAAPSTWTLGSGSTVEWPTDTQAGNGNNGVAQIIQSTEGAVGYIDLSDAKATGLTFASIVNKAGKAVAPTLEATSAALEGVVVNDDLSYDPLNADGEAAYPIAAPTWILVYKNQADKAEAAALRAFLTYLLTDGQALAAGVDYARLPASLQQKALDKVNQIVIPS